MFLSSSSQTLGANYWQKENNEMYELLYFISCNRDYYVPCHEIFENTNFSRKSLYFSMYNHFFFSEIRKPFTC